MVGGVIYVFSNWAIKRDTASTDLKSLVKLSVCPFLAEMNGLLMQHICIFKQVNRMNVCMSPKHCRCQNYVYHCLHIGMSTALLRHMCLTIVFQSQCGYVLAVLG